MAKVAKRFDKAIIISPTTTAAAIEGEVRVDSASDEVKAYLDGAERTLVSEDQIQQISNKTIDVDNNTVSNIEVDNLKSGVLNTSTTLAAASNTQIPSALAVKTYIEDSVAGKDQASEISSVPSGNLAASNVQAALDELQSDIDTRALNSNLTSHTGASSGVHGVTGSVVGTSDSQTLTNKTLSAAILSGLTKFSSYVSEETQNDASTGSAVVISSITKPIVRLTDSSLVSITGISELEDASHGGVITLVNATVSDIVILNNQGATVTQRILTGSADDITLAPDACLLLKYDSISDRWRVIGGTGGAAASFKKLAGENLTALDAVYMSEGAADGARTSGRIYKLSASSEKRIRFIGFAKATVSSGSSATIVNSGVLAGFTGLSAGLPLYLNPASAGGYTQTEPVTTDVWKLKIGLAISATEVLVLPDQGLNASFNEIEGLFTVANNQAAAANVTNLVFSSSVTKSFIIDYAIFRSTSSAAFAQAGRLRGVYNATNTQWLMSDDYSGENAGVTFTITTGGQVQYVSTNMAGTGYSGSLEYRVSSGDGVSVAGGGSGGSGINYITNPEFTENATGYNSYKDADQAAAENGTAGTATGVSIARSTSSPLRGAASGLISKTSGASRRGEGISIDFNIDSADQAKMLQISMDYTVTANYVDGDIRVYIFDTVNSVLIEPSQRDLLANSGNASYIANFQTASNSTSYRLIFHVATSTTLAYDLKIDNVKVSPSVIGLGAFISDWQSYTPTFTGFGTTSGAVAQWRRVGSSVEVEVSYTCGTPTGVEARVSLPSGMTIASTVTALTLVGFGDRNSTAIGWNILASAGNTYFNMDQPNNSGIIARNGDLISGAGEVIKFKASVAIQGWSSSITVSSQQTNKVIAYRAGILADQTIPSIAETLVNFNNFTVAETYDTAGAYAGANSAFSAPESGYYSFTASLLIENFTVSERLIASVRKTDASNSLINVVARYTDASSLATFIVNMSGSCYLLKGQGLNVSVDSTADASYTVTASTSSFFEVKKIQGNQTIGMDESVNMRYGNAAGTSIPSAIYTKLPFATKSFDSHNAFVTSGTYTFPISGKYSISISVRYQETSATSDYNVVTAVINGVDGVTFSNSKTGTLTSFPAVNGTFIQNFSKGDTLYFNGFHRHGVALALLTSADSNFITIHRVGN